MRLGSNAWLAPVLKLSVAVILIGVMITRKQLDFGWFADLKLHWAAFASLLAFIYVQLALTAVRWRLLLAALDVKIPFPASLRLTFIGCLFNSAIPGTIGGDVAKLYYLPSYCRGSSATGVVSLVVDRIAGLAGLAILGALPAIFTLIAGQAPRPLILVCWAVIGMAAVSVSGTFLMFRFGGAIAGPLSRRRASIYKAVVRMIETVTLYNDRRKAFVYALLISVLIHSMTCLCIAWAGHSVLGHDLPVRAIFLIMPLVLVSMAFPISPAGIGVGQAALYALFHFAGIPSAKEAANAFTVFQSALVLVYLSGAFSYLAERARMPAERAAEPAPHRN